MLTPHRFQLSFSLALFALLFVSHKNESNAWQEEQENPKTSKLYCEYKPPADKDNGKKIVLLSGDEEYRSEELMPMLGKLLAQRHGFHCFVLFPIKKETGEIDPTVQSNIPGLDQLKEADLVIMAWRFRNPPDEEMKHFVEYFESGRPIIALRTSTHAFKFDKNSTYAKYSFDSGKDWKGGFGKEILGETWVSHHGNHGSESTGGVIEPSAADHPILKGVKKVWGPSDVYGIRDLPADATVLMRGEVLGGMEPDSIAKAGDKRNDPMMPLVWVRELGAPDRDAPQRILTTTLGAATDCEHGDLTRLIVNGSYWCLGMEATITPDLDASPIETFKPTQFGFNKFVTGRKPSDHDLKAQGSSPDR